MKLIPTLALFTLAASMAIPGALAQGVTLRADVPFGFNVGSTVMPAGEYLISSPISGIVRVENTDKDISATVTTLHGYNEAGHGSKLVFEKYGEHYFLHRVLCPTFSSMNVDITSWNAEKKVRSREAKVEHSEQVLVAAR